MTSERHSVQLICTLRNICWKRPENSLPSAFPSIFQAIQKLLSGKKCRKNSCVIQCQSCCSSQMGAQEKLGEFIPFCSSVQLGTLWPITAFWNIHVMQISKLPHFYLKCSCVSPESNGQYKSALKEKKNLEALKWCHHQCIFPPLIFWLLVMTSKSVRQTWPQIVHSS